jgi:osmoprotectant transport system permease protein
MGMTGLQRLAMVELPLALPVIMVGIRIATVSTIGIATIAAVIGAGGLGRLILDGMRTLDNDRIFAGALVASALALIADWVLGRLGDFLRRDLKTSGRR